MSVGVLHKGLLGSIRTPLARQTFGTPVVQMLFPSIQIVDHQRKVAAAMVGMYRLIAIANQMKLLVDPQLKPGPGKIERGPIHHRKLERVAIETNTGWDVGNMKCHMIELANLHHNRIFNDRI